VLKRLFSEKRNITEPKVETVRRTFCSKNSKHKVNEQIIPVRKMFEMGYGTS